MISSLRQENTELRHRLRQSESRNSRHQLHPNPNPNPSHPPLNSSSSFPNGLPPSADQLSVSVTVSELQAANGKLRRQVRALAVRDYLINGLN